jgi:hypothetical protein
VSFDFRLFQQYLPEADSCSAAKGSVIRSHARHARARWRHGEAEPSRFKIDRKLELGRFDPDVGCKTRGVS